MSKLQYIGVIGNSQETRDQLYARVGLIFMSRGLVEVSREPRIIPNYDSEFNLLQRAYLNKVTGVGVVTREIPINFSMQFGFIPKVRLQDILFTNPTRNGFVDLLMRFTYNTPDNLREDILQELRSKSLRQLSEIGMVLPENPEERG